MNKGFLWPTLLLLCIGTIGCLSLAYVPTRKIAVIPAGAHEQLSLKVDLPKHSASWEIGLWPATGETNIANFAGKHLVAKVTNRSKRSLTLSPGVSSPFSSVLIVTPGQSVVVCDAPVKSLAQIALLFGCNTREHSASVHLNLEFRPTLQLEKQLTVLARGRDAL